LKRSPLDAEHRTLGAKMVPFGGWEMPLVYGRGTIAEHLACRQRAVAFDVSHLGTVRVTNDGAFIDLQANLTNDLNKITPGRAQYTHLCDDDGSVLDDIIVWWIEDDWFDVMPNASNTFRVRAALGGEDVTAGRAVIAVQGPEARRLLDAVVPAAATVTRFGVTRFSWDDEECIAAGTGYTGEDGVELSVPAAMQPVCGGGFSPPAWSPLASAPVTRCDWRRGCRSMATSSVPGSRLSRPGSPGWWGGTSRTSAARAPSRRSGPRASRDG
jgi:aminomethyltransferase